MYVTVLRWHSNGIIEGLCSLMQIVLRVAERAHPIFILVYNHIKCKSILVYSMVRTCKVRKQFMTGSGIVYLQTTWKVQQKVILCLLIYFLDRTIIFSDSTLFVFYFVEHYHAMFFRQRNCTQSAPLNLVATS